MNDIEHRNVSHARHRALRNSSEHARAHVQSDDQRDEYQANGKTRKQQHVDRASGHSTLSWIAMIAPAFAQAIMVIVLLIERRWLFAIMVVPGLVGCIASVLLTLSRTQTSRNSTGEHSSAISHTSANADEASSALAFANLSCPSLETLNGLTADPLAWRVIVRNWLHSPSLRVVIGVDATGPVTIDLTKQGPHALVAGTTGSGKSVLLQSWCLAMACQISPAKLRFVFLDFKGGSAFSKLEQLPHMVGSVCDLNLKHAVRALKALEAELTRREHLVAVERAGSVGELIDPPPTLVIVIDEFHALKNQLPDYVDRLVHIAALGRSLGMHVIACTQNPLGQVSADMKANMTLNICLRVRDALQSTELLGDGRAASISPSLPGCAWRNDGESVEPLRCAVPTNMDDMVTAIELACAFHDMHQAPALFTAPLPALVTLATLTAMSTTSDTGSNSRTYSPSPNGLRTDLSTGQRTVANPTREQSTTQVSRNTCSVPFALADDGANVSVAQLALGAIGNVGIIGPAGRGKSTLLASLAMQVSRIDGISVRITERVGRAYHSRTGNEFNATDTHGTTSTCRTSTCSANDAHDTVQLSSSAESYPSSSSFTSSFDTASPTTMIWFVDDADALFDPFGTDPMCAELRAAITDPYITVVFAVESSKHIRVPEHCRTRVVFPTGERTVDLMDGIPASLLADCDHNDIATAGRGVLLHGGEATLVQVALPS